MARNENGATRSPPPTVSTTGPVRKAPVTRREFFDAISRQDFVTFVRRVFNTVAPAHPYLHNWHVDLVCDDCVRVVAGDVRRLIINLPPRMLKSIIASVALPAWILGRNPTARIICASYAADLAAKHASDFRSVVESAWYRDVFPQAWIDPRINSIEEVATTAGGYRLATSVGGTLTGRGADYIIIDDPLKAEDAHSEAKRETANRWATSTVLTRLDDKARGAIILAMHRLHPDDLAGHLLGKGGWSHRSLSAIAESDESFVLRNGRIVGRRSGDPLHASREGLGLLAEARREIGSHNFEAQYQQNPLSLEGGIIKWSWFRSYARPPERNEGTRVVQSWDTAFTDKKTSDYSACTTWLQSGIDHYLLDVFRQRASYPELKKIVVEHAARYEADAVLIENKASGISLIQDLSAAGKVSPIAYDPVSDKLSRMHAQSARIESGNVWLPQEADWLDAFRMELVQFPRGRHDDQIDSTSQYLAWAADNGVAIGEASVNYSRAAIALGLDQYVQAKSRGEDVSGFVFGLPRF